ncbi:hypothetical protein V8E36_006963 [Tilletia maclaganii]
MPTVTSSPAPPPPPSRAAPAPGPSPAAGPAKTPKTAGIFKRIWKHSASSGSSSTDDTLGSSNDGPNAGQGQKRGNGGEGGGGGGGPSNVTSQALAAPATPRSVNGTQEKQHNGKRSDASAPQGWASIRTPSSAALSLFRTRSPVRVKTSLSATPLPTTTTTTATATEGAGAASAASSSSLQPELGAALSTPQTSGGKQSASPLHTPTQRVNGSLEATSRPSESAASGSELPLSPSPAMPATPTVVSEASPVLQRVNIAVSSPEAAAAQPSAERAASFPQEAQQLDPVTAAADEDRLLPVSALTETRSNGSRSDSSASPTTDRSSRVLSEAPSISTSTATTPALLTPASSAGESIVPSAGAPNKLKNMASLVASDSGHSSSLAVPSTERKRRSFLGIKLGGSSKQVKSSATISPVDNQAPALPDAWSSQRERAAGISPIQESPSEPPQGLPPSPGQSGQEPALLLPGEGGRVVQPWGDSPSTRSAKSSRQSVRNSFHPQAAPSKSASNAGSTSSRRRYKDTRDLSLLASELAAEEAAAAAFYRQQEALHAQHFALSQSHGLRVPQASGGLYQGFSDANGSQSASPSRNASQTSLPLNVQSPVHERASTAPGRTTGAADSASMTQSELGAIEDTAMNGKRASFQQEAGHVQSSASSWASHGQGGQLSASLPSSPPNSSRQRQLNSSDGNNWDAASSHSARSGFSTPSHTLSAASAAFRSRAAALGFSHLDAAMTGASSLIIDPFGIPMHSDSPFDASRTFRSWSSGNLAASGNTMVRANESTHSLAYSQAGGPAASTSSLNGTFETQSVDGAGSASHGSGQRVRRSVLTMSLYNPDTETQGRPEQAGARARESSAESSKAAPRSSEKASRLSSPFGSRAPSRTVTPKSSSKALDEAIRQEERLRIKEEKRRVKEEKRLDQSNAKRIRQMEKEMSMVARDPRGPKETKAEALTREAEKEKQRALAKGVDEALRRAQEAQGVALQEQYKRQQQLLQKPRGNGSASRTSSRPSSNHDASPGGAARVSSEPPPSGGSPSPAQEVPAPTAAIQSNGQSVKSSADRSAAVKAGMSPERPVRSPNRVASSTSLKAQAAAAVTVPVPEPVPAIPQPAEQVSAG